MVRLSVVTLLMILIVSRGDFVCCGIRLLSRLLYKLTSSCTLPVNMRIYGVDPDVTQDPPDDIMMVKFPSGARVAMGNVLTPTDVKDAPLIEFSSRSSKLYTLSFIDLDVSVPYDTAAQSMHWLVVNIPGDKVNDGETIYEYIGASPRNGTGMHRYVFLAFQQKGIISCDEPKQTIHQVESRVSISIGIRDFAIKYRLGKPVSGNFFLAKYDDYVPILYSQINDVRIK